MAEGAKSTRVCVIDAAEPNDSQGKKFLSLSLMDEAGKMFEASYWRDKRLEANQADPLWDGIVALAGTGEQREIAFFQPGEANGGLKVNRDGTPKLYVNSVAGVEGAPAGGRGGAPGAGMKGGLTIDQQIRRSALELAIMAKSAMLVKPENTIGATAALFAEHIRNGQDLPV